MATYAEYLKSMGATDEDLKVLVNPKSEAAFNKMQADLTAASEARDAAIKAKTEYDNWYQNELTPSVQKIYAESATIKGENAKLNAQLKAMQDYGLAAVAGQGDDDAAKKAAAAAAANGNGASNIDLSKYVDRDTLLQVAEKEGEAIAIMADIAEEHRELFGTRINARELRKEAVQRKIPLEQLWMEKYKVADKRAERAAADKAAHEKKIADDAIAKFKADNPTMNPMLNPMAASNHPVFVKRDAAAKQPWDRAGDTSRDRVEKVVQKLNQTGA